MDLNWCWLFISWSITFLDEEQGRQLSGDNPPPIPLSNDISLHQFLAYQSPGYTFPTATFSLVWFYDLPLWLDDAWFLQLRHVHQCRLQSRTWQDTAEPNDLSSRDPWLWYRFIEGTSFYITRKVTWPWVSQRLYCWKWNTSLCNYWNLAQTSECSWDGWAHTWGI